MVAFMLGFFLGVFLLLGYMLKRMLGNAGWDDSNLTNAFRLLGHVVLHPEDFGQMFYLIQVSENEPGATHVQVGNGDYIWLKRPFWYVSKDEFEGVVKTRPD